MRVLPNSIPTHAKGLYQKLPALCETALAALNVLLIVYCLLLITYCLLFYFNIFLGFLMGTFGICPQFYLMTSPLFPEFQLYN